MYLRAICHERTGDKVRCVQSVMKDPEAIWWIYDRIKDIPNFITANPPEFTHESMLWLFLPEVKIYMVDDVGVIVLRRLDPRKADVHITFWDKILRGRERLCQLVAKQLFRDEVLNELVTAIPSESRAILAFALRVGFKRRSLPGDPIQLLSLRNQVFTVKTPSMEAVSGT